MDILNYLGKFTFQNRECITSVNKIKELRQVTVADTAFKYQQ